MTTETVISKGTKVKYHGSMTSKHGVYRVLGIDPYAYQDDSGPRYHLQKDGGKLADSIANVRRQSFSIIGEETPDYATVSLSMDSWEAIIYHLNDQDECNEWGDKLRDLAEEIDCVVHRQ